MSAAAFLRVKKLKGGGIGRAAARHNLREIQAELGAGGNLDPTRMHMNVVMHGPGDAADVAALAKTRMQAAGVGKLRKDAVQAIELVFSLPPVHVVDKRHYFADCLAWAGARFGADNILSAVAHHDEAAPHMHVLLLPLVGNKMAGSELVGNRRTLADMQAAFPSAVASHHGLRKAPKRLAGHSKDAAAHLVLKHLRAANDGVLRSAAWPTIRDAIERDPAPYMDALGLHLVEPQKKAKTMAQIFTSKGKGPRRELPKPIGFDDDESTEPYRVSAPKKDRTLCSVGFAPNQPPATPQNLPIKAAPPAPSPSPAPCPQAIQSLPELWTTVGCKSKWTTPRPDRLRTAKAAMQQAADHHTRKRRTVPLPAARVGDDGITRERDEYAHDLSSWD